MKNYSNFITLIPSQKESMINLLISWAEINSSSLNPSGLSKILAELHHSFSLIPNSTASIINQGKDPGKQLLKVISRPEAPLQILLVGHMDTVYPKDSSFQKTTLLSEGMLQGPGVTDMKGGLIVLLYALKALEETPWKTNLGWQVLLNQDEEIGSPHSKEILKQEAKKFHLGLCFEPSLPDGSLARTRMGSGLFTVEAKGQAAHAGRDFHKGKNAIASLAKILLQIHELNNSLPDTILNIGKIQGGGPVNVVPDSAQAKINIRVKTQKAAEMVLKSLQTIESEANFHPEEQIKITGNFGRPPKELSPGIDFIYQSIKSCAQELGINLEWKDTGGACDGNDLAYSGLPIIDNLGVQGDNIHSENEYILTDSLTERTQLAALFLMRLASGEIALPKTLFTPTEK